MTVNRSIAVACVAVGVAVAVLAFLANAQGSPSARPVRVVYASVAESPAVTPTSAANAPAAADIGKLITRETYSYQGVGRRDPFLSLMNTEELRPLYQDLKLVAIAYDPLGRNSVAVLRDVTSKEQYRVRVGQEIGRMRVASISQKSVTFGIEEFGYSRQETLAMHDSTKVRTQ